MSAVAASMSSGRRVPLAVVLSIALHGSALLLYVYVAQLSKKQTARVIGDVDLLVQVKKPVASKPSARPAAAPANMFNFLKMALPAIPKIEAQRLEVKLPQQQRLKMQSPKLEDRGKRFDQNKLEALNLDERRPDAAKLDVAKVETRRAPALAAMPKLEEVGRRQVRNLPAAIKLEEERQQAIGLQRMQALTTPSHRRAGPAAVEALREAEPAETGRFANKIASMLPTQAPALELKPERRESNDALKKRVVMEPSKRAEAQGLQPEAPKKGIELEGPIKDRKIVSYEVPEFPSWAKDQGILEASVAIRFWVNPQGDVLDNMRVERTSGFGRLDRLSMDALKNWKFAPVLNNEKQWGVITFRYVLE
jgi:TonB family protein